ncbi:MAG: hypothetical protein LQ343_006217 [Gyalolechia ehrenbergii]|nr:MAG: hypothetical protein LQ343_006217 [Gyalolechia ehrenbergii]
MSFADRIPAHDLEARRAARESRQRPWLDTVDQGSLQKARFCSNQRLQKSRPASTGVSTAPLSSALQRRVTQRERRSRPWIKEGKGGADAGCMIPTPSTSLSSSESAPITLCFKSPLVENPKTTDTNKFLKDSSGFGVLLSFLETRRTVDIPVLQKLGLAHYLRRTTEATSFDWFRHWMPQQVDSLMLAHPDQLDIPSWAMLLRDSLDKVPAEALGLPDRSDYLRHLEDISQIRHDAVHRKDFSTENILRAVRHALAFKDETRAKELQQVVKALYENGTRDDPLGSPFVDSALDLSLRVGKSQFDMLYVVKYRLCRKLFEFIKVTCPDELSGQLVEQTEFSDLQGIFAINGQKWFSSHEADIVYGGLRRLCRELRNRVEHRNMINADELRSIAYDAGNVMLTIGQPETAKDIMYIRQRFAQTISQFKPEDCPSRLVQFLRRMKHLNCWETPTLLESSKDPLQPLVVREKHPYLHCMRSITEGLMQQAQDKRYRWAGQDAIGRTIHGLTDFGISHLYEITAKWYRKISEGEIDVDEARSPVVDYWDGKLDDRVEEPLCIPRPPQRARYDPWNLNNFTSDEEEGRNSGTPESSTGMNEDVQQLDSVWPEIVDELDPESNLEVGSWIGKTVAKTHDHWKYEAEVVSSKSEEVLEIS